MTSNFAQCQAGVRHDQGGNRKSFRDTLGDNGRRSFRSDISQEIVRIETLAAQSNE